MLPRGIRNNNPLNIRRSKDQWKGLAEAPSNENDTNAYIANVSKLTGIDPDEPIGIPSESPTRWIALGVSLYYNQPPKHRLVGVSAIFRQKRRVICDDTINISSHK